MESSGIWNYLHDGSVDRIERTDAGDVVLLVGISYLRRLFPGEGESFVLVLRDCADFSLTTDDGQVVTSLAEIERKAPELLSVVSEHPLRIYTTAGTLAVSCSSTTLSLESGEPVSAPMLAAASARYWSEWSKRREGGV